VKTLVLPLAFERMPPPSILDEWDHSPIKSTAVTRFGLRAKPKSGNEVDLYLPLDSTSPVRPRDVIATLALYGPTLRPYATDSNQDRINRDIRNISFRTLASLILTIPILVLVWSPTPLTSTTTSHSIQLALATLVVGVAWPVYSGSFRSAYYLHRADLGVLTAFSTLTSYIFSVVAFGFEVVGRDIGAPFFETVGLLITLIFAGRTLQASTRKLGLKAVNNLGRLQPETACLVQEDQEGEFDVR
jgi:cation transport ATPase